MLVWGSGGGHAQIAEAGTGLCANCNAVRPFSFGVNYRYAHIWYIFKWITSRSYVRLCSVCEKGSKVTKAEALAGGVEPKLPGLPRWVWVAIAALIIGLVILGFQSAEETKRRVADMVAHPKTGDVYLLDLANVSSSYSDGHAYGLMKVTTVAKDGGLTVVTANEASDRLSGARKDLRKSDYAADANFDADDPIELSAARVAQLRDAGTFEDIRR